jgi:hypothetical protein
MNHHIRVLWLHLEAESMRHAILICEKPNLPPEQGGILETDWTA